MSRKRVVIVGGGFGGLQAAQALRSAPVDVTVVDRRNHHLFQPLLYQVATAGLEPADIALPIRSLLRKQKNTRTLLGEAVGADWDQRELLLANGRRLDFDYLIIAAGAVPNYFGNDDWEEHAISLKDVPHAIQLRERILMAFEAAEQESDPSRRQQLLTFVVIGGGPTGVEMAGAISELGRTAMARDFHNVEASEVRVVLVEMADRVLLPFDPKLSRKAEEQLKELHVDVRLGERVVGVERDGVQLEKGFINAATVCWASGVKPQNLGASLGFDLDRRGAIRVNADCSVIGHPNVFAIGDIAAYVPEGQQKPLPGVAPVAIQQGRYVAKTIRTELRANKVRKPFQYLDKGSMATIGRSRAVAESGPIKLSGWLAWLGWLGIHILYLNGFRNRLVVLFNWVWSYVTFKRGARLISKDWKAPVLHPHEEAPILLKDTKSSSLPESVRSVPRMPSQSSSANQLGRAPSPKPA